MGQGMVYGWLKMEELKQLVAVERLAQLEHNKTKCAESLGVTRTTLDSILKGFEKRSAEDKARIKTNNEKMKVILNQESNTFGHDTNTGMSTPLAPRPLPKIELIIPKETGEDPLSKAANAINNEPRTGNAFKPTVKPLPAPKETTPLMTEAQKEHARFAKLDKTPYSKTHDLEAREIREKAEMNKTTKPSKKVTKKSIKKATAKREKAGRKAS